MEELIRKLLIDKEVVGELKEQILSIVKSTEFSNKFKKSFINAVEKDLLLHMDELLDDVWDDLRNKFVAEIKKNFSLSLLPKEPTKK